MIVTYDAWLRVRRDLFKQCGAVQILNGCCVRKLARLAAAIDYLDSVWDRIEFKPLYSDEYIDQLRCDCPQCGQRVLPATLEPPGSV